MQPQTRKERDEQIAFRKWQAVFYTLRTLLWEDSKGRIFLDAIESGVLEAVAPFVKLPDGSLSRAEFDGDDIKELYSEAWEKFNTEFDEAFIKATLDEMVDSLNSQEVYSVSLVLTPVLLRSKILFVPLQSFLSFFIWSQILLTLINFSRCP